MVTRLIRVAFDDWQGAIGALFQLGERSDRPVPVIIDEFPYLLDQVAAVPSLIQIALSPRGRAMRHSRTRLILCGSALTTMQQLLSGTAPLRGRASLEMMVHPFSYREAAEFWGSSATRNWPSGWMRWSVAPRRTAG